MLNKNTVGIILFLLVFHASPASTDPVGNVRYYRVTDERIIIYYDLSETESGFVTVRFSLDGGISFKRVTNGLFGDIGEGIGPCTNKRIVWDITTDTIIRSRNIVIEVDVRVDSPVKPVLTVDYKQKAIITHRIDSPVKLDGLSNEPAWEGIKLLPVVMQIPRFGIEPSERIEILLAYDNEYLYVAGRLFDSQPSKIHATTMKRDDTDVPVDEYEFYNLMGIFSTPGGRLLRAKSTFYAGEFYDGRRVSLSLEPSRSISSHLELGGTYQLNFVEFPDRNREFTAHIGRLRVLAMLNVRYSLTAFVQYNSAADKAIANIRFRYNPREGTDLYLVYDEGINTDRRGDDPILPVTSDCTVMLKYSYMFNL